MKKLILLPFLLLVSNGFAAGICGSQTLSTTFNPFTGKQDYVCTGTSGGGTASLPLPPGDTNYIQNRPTLQANTTAYPMFLYVGSSATVNGPVKFTGIITASNTAITTAIGLLDATQLSGTVPNASIDSIFWLTASSAVSTYLQLSSATANYLALSSATANYLRNGSALNANNLTTGTLPDGRLSSNVSLLNAVQNDKSTTTYSGVNTFNGGTAILGHIDASNQTSGYVGYISSANTTNVAPYNGSNIWFNISTVTLPAGNFLITGTGQFSGSTQTRNIIALSIFPDNTTTDQISGITQMDAPLPTAALSGGASLIWIFRSTTTFNVYLKGRVTFAAGSPTISGGEVALQLP